ncbi:hypothetical protein GGF46_003335 [Coemansia sp. RSA 552]|nr:hypothetical protein GGF46_003335 [Coemansia sp. RSA 552]
MRRVSVGCCALALALVLLVPWATRRSQLDSGDDGQRRAFERAWWQRFNRLSYAQDSAFARLPATVRRSVDALLTRPDDQAAFRQSIAGRYHAQWRAAHIHELTEFWNGTLPEGHVRPADASSGVLSMTLQSGRPASGTASLVRGSAELKASGFVASLHIQGLYWPLRGVAVLYSEPEISSQTTADVVRAMPSRAAFAAAKSVYKDALDGHLLSYRLPEETRHDCSYQIFVRFAPGHDQDNPHAQALLFAPRCNAMLSMPDGSHVAGFSATTFTRKTTHYIRAILATLLAQTMLVMVQMCFTPTHAAMSMVSYWTLSMQVVLDSYGFIIHILGCLALGGAYLAGAGAAVVVYMLTMAFTMRYLTVVWHTQCPEASETLSASDRGALWRIYLRFYAALVPGVYIIYAFVDGGGALSRRLLAVLLFVVYSYWVPQIWRNARRGIARGLRAEYIVGTTLARLFIPVYFLACPKNIAFVAPTPLAWGLAAYSLAQAGVLLLQQALGARFFVPPSLRPETYDYHPPLPPLLGTDEEACIGINDSGDDVARRAHVCTICILPVSDATPATHAVTPCHHVYHAECLSRWMDVKLECPVCRAELPPV